mmetsp:Transcript_33268/g.85914  ORF Transcript_33268/g.85914 Transcript_33268/m.85914 type:complete len:142 (-) Transcript_33268:133-558(-)
MPRDDEPPPVVFGQRDDDRGVHDVDLDLETPTSMASVPDGVPGGSRPRMEMSNPEDIPDSLPPGKVKLLAFMLVFALWVGGSGFLDQVIEVVSFGKKWVTLLLYLVITAGGAVGLKVIAKKYKGYALLDEIREMEEATMNG